VTLPGFAIELVESLKKNSPPCLTRRSGRGDAARRRGSAERDVADGRRLGVRHPSRRTASRQSRKRGSCRTRSVPAPMNRVVSGDAANDGNSGRSL